jgi:hypothetical protein
MRTHVTNYHQWRDKTQERVRNYQCLRHTYIYAYIYKLPLAHNDMLVPQLLRNLKGSVKGNPALLQPAVQPRTVQVEILNNRHVLSEGDTPGHLGAQRRPVLRRRRLHGADGGSALRPGGPELGVDSKEERPGHERRPRAGVVESRVRRLLAAAGCWTT